jgi:hypothetical protein
MEELPSFGCRWCCKAALCVFFYPLPLFVAFTPEYILPSCMFKFHLEAGHFEDVPKYSHDLVVPRRGAGAA